MTRLPAAAVLLLLRREGLVIGAATLRQWKTRGHISKGTDYDVLEIIEYVKKRYATRPLTSA